MANKTFDIISNEFSSTINQTKEFVRTPLFLKLIGDVRNKRVADFGCGDGYFTRILAQGSPKETVGVDYSAPMLKLAMERGRLHSQKISYLLDDVRFLKLNKRFNLIAAVYLLDYAESKEDLFNMVRTVFYHLEPNGIFCAIVPHPNIQPMKEFEFERRVTSVDNKKVFNDGDKLQCEIQKDNKRFKFIFYYWSQETYTTVLKEVGFRNILWVESFVSEDGIKQFGTEYWKRFVKYPSSIGLICYK